MEKPNELHNWTITYDNMGLPGFIQALIRIDREKESSIGHPITLSLFSLDLSSSTAVDIDGNTYSLVGPGTQAIYFSQIEPFSIIKTLDDDKDPDHDA